MEKGQGRSCLAQRLLVRGQGTVLKVLGLPGSFSFGQLSKEKKESVRLFERGCCQPWVALQKERQNQKKGLVAGTDGNEGYRTEFLGLKKGLSHVKLTWLATYKYRRTRRSYPKQVGFHQFHGAASSSRETIHSPPSARGGAETSEKHLFLYGSYQRKGTFSVFFPLSFFFSFQKSSLTKGPLKLKELAEKIAFFSCCHEVDL